jgi:nucleotide-binding universal stress UspA family protein
MGSFNTILLCYDSTREGRRALLQGAELAEKLGAATHLLAIASSVEVNMVEPPSQMVMHDQENQINEVLREGVERLKARGLDATGHLAFGRPIDHIPTFANQLGVDLIVIGHKPCGPVARWWAGPGNAQLLDRVCCSILVSIDPDDQI